MLPKGFRSPGTKEIIAYRQSNPCLYLRQVGDKFGVSREFIRQICKRDGIRTTSIKYGLSTKCPICGRRKTSSAKSCFNCYHQKHSVPLVCPQCGEVFERKQSAVIHSISKDNQQRFFCSYSCRSLFFWYQKKVSNERR